MKTATSTQFSLLVLLSASLMASDALAQSAGQVVAWGNNLFGQTNVPAAAQSGVVAIAMGTYHMVALKNDGSVVAWGKNNNGQTNVPAAAQNGVVAIAAGAHHMVALKNDGAVVAWGWNQDGQTNVPIGLSGVTAIAAGWVQTMAFRGSGWELGAPLALRPSGNAMILSWPTNATGFTLQSAPDLTPPMTWLDVANPPTVLGGQFTVTNTPSVGAQFFRLRRP